MQSKGILYLIPVLLGDTEVNQVLPLEIEKTLVGLQSLIVENSKAARKYIKSISPTTKQSDLKLFELNKHTDQKEIKSFLDPLLNGENMGLMSDAGCPGVADPGAVVVKYAHELGIEVRPLVGPSSILLSLMGSGMNGQSFVFHGYLPIDKNEKKQKLKAIERVSFEQKQSQIFIETPYRNNQMLADMIQILHPNTKLCIACDLTLPTQFLQTQRISYWKKNTPDLHKKPCVFIIYKE
ncbi:SAM-dependent methyltransferase [Capnocytophaga sp. ARDL2]|uniref:SAM-dependent methyltransferase n=1 Tax=Capnocytophaga sp. ARDL2 TaxID=3238809 RepID=UPI003557059F